MGRETAAYSKGSLCLSVYFHSDKPKEDSDGLAAGGHPEPIALTDVGYSYGPESIIRRGRAAPNNSYLA